jgi:hypothetical protein
MYVSKFARMQISKFACLNERPKHVSIFAYFPVKTKIYLTPWCGVRPPPPTSVSSPGGIDPDPSILRHRHGKLCTGRSWEAAVIFLFGCETLFTRVFRPVHLLSPLSPQPLGCYWLLSLKIWKNCKLFLWILGTNTRKNEHFHEKKFCWINAFGENYEKVILVFNFSQKWA